jgi:hypothetical protein
MRTLLTTATAVVISLFLFCPGVSLAGVDRITDGNLFRIELRIDPPQPVVGNNSVLLDVYDAKSNERIDDAEIDVVPWMTMHGHGSSKKPTVQKQGSGRYRVENVFFTMEGDWDLLITIQKKGAKDTATFPISHVIKK